MPKTKGPLHELILKACPLSKHGRPSITLLANRLDVTTQTIHRVTAINQISAKLARKICEASENPIAIEDFLPFMGH